MEIVFRSDTGKKRKNNQDFAGYFINKKNIRLAILCDGMGGHRGGDVASEMAVSHLGHTWEESDVQDAEQITQWMLTRISRENKRILEKSRKFFDLEGMGTTLVAAAVVDQEFVIANIGDSRAYHYTGGRLNQVTEDHSLVNDLIKIGELTPEDAENYPRKNVITRALQPHLEHRYKADIVTLKDIRPNDFFYMCSDGMLEEASNANLCFMLNLQKTEEEIIKMLVLNSQHNRDNHSAHLIHILDVENNNRSKSYTWKIKHFLKETYYVVKNTLMK